MSPDEYDNEHERSERERFEDNVPDEGSGGDDLIADEPASQSDIDEYSPSDEGGGNPAGTYASEDAMVAATPDRGGGSITYSMSGVSSEGGEDVSISPHESGNEVEYEGPETADEGSDTGDYEQEDRERFEANLPDEESASSEYIADEPASEEEIEEHAPSGDGFNNQAGLYADEEVLEAAAGERDAGTDADMGDTHPNMRDARGRFLGRKDQVQLNRDDEGNLVGYNPNTDEERVVAYSEDIADEEPRTTFGSLEAQTGDDERGYGETEQMTFGDFGATEEGQSTLDEYQVELDEDKGIVGSNREAREALDSLEDAKETREARQDRLRELADEDDGTLASGFAPQDESSGDDYEDEAGVDTTPDVDEAIPEDALAVSESGDAGIYISREDQTVYVRDHEGHIGHYDLEGRDPTRMSINPNEVVEFDEEGYEVIDAETDETIFGQTFDEYIEDEGVASGGEAGTPGGSSSGAGERGSDGDHGPGGVWASDDEEGSGSASQDGPMPGVPSTGSGEEDRSGGDSRGLDLQSISDSRIGNEVTYNGPDTVNNQTYLIGSIGGSGSEEAVEAFVDAFESDNGGEGYSPEDIVDAVVGRLGDRGEDEYSPEDIVDAVADAVGDDGEYNPEDVADAVADAFGGADGEGGAGGAGGDGAGYSPEDIVDAVADAFEDLGPGGGDEPAEDTTGPTEPGSPDEPGDEETDDTYDDRRDPFADSGDDDDSNGIGWFNNMLESLRMDEFLGVSSSTYAGKQVFQSGVGNEYSSSEMVFEDARRRREQEEDEDDS